MEILLEPTSNKLMVERFDTSAGNPVKEILLKLNLPDHRSILTDLKIYINMVMERKSVKVKERFKEVPSPDTERLFSKLRIVKVEQPQEDHYKSIQVKNQESMSMSSKVTSSQMAQVYKMKDYALLMISSASDRIFNTRQAKEQAQDLKSTITTSIHKLMIKVKDYELKTKVKA
ncbi:hypothetical protein Tco_0852213 [Tanacetum coccineum]